MDSFVVVGNDGRSDVGDGSLTHSHTHTHTHAHAPAAHEDRHVDAQILHETLTALLGSSDKHDKTRGLALIVRGLQMGVELSTERLSNYTLQALPPHTTDTAVIAEAAKAIGTIAKSQLSAMHGEFFRLEARRAAEWLNPQPGNSGRRYAAVLILRELALQDTEAFAETLLSSDKAPLLVDNLFASVHDQKLSMREAGVAALKEILFVSASCEIQIREAILGAVFQHIDNGFTKNKEDSIHGSLLAIGVVAERDNSFRNKRLQIEVYRKAIRYVSGGAVSALLQRTAITLIPVLAHSIPPQLLTSALSITHPDFAQENQRLFGGSASEVIEKFEAFRKEMMDIAIPALLRMSSRDKSDRIACFIAAGKLALVLGPAIESQLEQLTRCIQSSLLPRGSHASSNPQASASSSTAASAGANGAPGHFGLLVVSHAPGVPREVDPVREAALQCVAMLVSALKERATHVVNDLLGVMLSGHLSEGLVAALQAIVMDIPTARSQVTKELSKKIRNYLLEVSAKQPTPEQTDVIAYTQLVLNTLGNFNFGEGDDSPSYELLLRFARDGVLPLLSSRVVSIREEACLTCARLLIPSHAKRQRAPSVTVSAQNSSTYHSFVSAAKATNSVAAPGPRETSKDTKKKNSTLRRAIVNEVLRVLLRVVVSDPSESIRFAVFHELDSESLDAYMIESDNFMLLFPVLQDDTFEIKLTAIAVLGRLMKSKPCEITPVLRTFLTELLTDLGTKQDIGREDALTLLTRVITANPIFVRPHAGSIMKVLCPFLNAKEPSVVTGTLLAIGELAQAGCLEVREYLDTILPILLKISSDQSSSIRRKAALTALGNICQGVGAVIDIYYEHRNLLSVLTEALRRESNPMYRKDIIRTIGIIGAPDPFIIREKVEGPEAAPSDDSNGNSSSILSRLELHERKGSDSYYVAVALNALFILGHDAGLHRLHVDVVRAIMVSVEFLPDNVFEFLGNIVDCFIAMIETSKAEKTDWMFFVGELGKIIRQAKTKIVPHAEKLMALIRNSWTVTDEILFLVEQLSLSLSMAGALCVYLPQILMLIVKSMNEDRDPDRSPTIKLFRMIPVFGDNLVGYLHIVVPSITRFLQETGFGVKDLCRHALQCLLFMSVKAPLREFATMIFHRLVRLLETSQEHRTACLRLLSRLVCELGHDYITFGFMAMVNDVMVRQCIQDHVYERTVRCLLNGNPFGEIEVDIEANAPSASKSLRREESFAPLSPMKSDAPGNKSVIRGVNPQNLKAAWEGNSQDSSVQDWTEWTKRLTKALLRESPSPVLRACSRLAEMHPPLGRDLFNAAFVSCWSGLYIEDQEDLVQQIERALKDESESARKLQQIILDLAEFMEFMNQGRLSIPEKTLGEKAFQSRSFAKALHYKEREFFFLTIEQSKHRLRQDSDSVVSTSTSTLQPYILDSYMPPVNFMSERRKKDDAIMDEELLKSCVESLIEISNALQQPDSAAGVLDRLQSDSANLIDLSSIRPEWYEKLGKWDVALSMYESGESLLSETENLIGKMRCLHSMARWPDLHTTFNSNWRNLRSMLVQSNDQERLECVARIGCWAAFNTAHWEDLYVYLTDLPEDDSDHAFFGSVLAIRSNKMFEAEQLINKCRTIIDTPLSIALYESYDRAYDQIMKAQMLCELEEAIAYRLAADDDVIKSNIRNMWRKRLFGGPRNSRVWQQLLNLRSLALAPHDDLVVQLKFSELCLSEGNIEASRKVLVQLVGETPLLTKDLSSVSQPPVKFALLQHLWETESDRRVVVENLRKFVQSTRGTPTDRNLMARCHFELGKWQQRLDESAGVSRISESVAQDYLEATRLDPQWYEAWQTWALTNYQMASQLEEQIVELGEETTRLRRALITRVVSAIQGFFRSISLKPDISFQDTLRLLSLWCKYGHEIEVDSVVAEGRATASLDIWLQLIPQLIARIDIPALLTRKAIHNLILHVGKQHPQSVIIPLQVATKSGDTERAAIVQDLLNKIRQHSNDLVTEAVLMSDELIRVSALWHEVWYTGFQEASRLLFELKDPAGMMKVFDHLHRDNLERPETPRELGFAHSFRAELERARDWLNLYKKTKSMRDMNAAWTVYLKIFYRIQRMLPKLSTLDLHCVSPKLNAAKNLRLVIPGTYNVNSENVRIAAFHPKLSVIQSKQRPRKIKFIGENGQEYQFLLKGHEDPRMDERVMAFFGLVNSLLKEDTSTSKNHLKIMRYSITPLAPTTGLIEWVANCDTLYSLIVQRRQQTKVSIHLERSNIRLMAPETVDSKNNSTDKGYENLTVMQKVEIFLRCFANAPGDDLAAMIRQKSLDSESWLHRRTNYTRSLAVMSMVGHVLGLGDRHLSNIMLERSSGHILHIDFGDCFEAAKEREKFPEKVPFRLTRMLIQAMEVGGISGTYRVTCENVMSVLRKNKESLLAVLEAFIHDPILSIKFLHFDTNTHLEESVMVESPEGSSSFSPERKTSTSSHDNSSNNKAIQLVRRVALKLHGREFEMPGFKGEDQKEANEISVHEQVMKLIKCATLPENLAQAFLGWYPFW